ncbi:MAG: hypothetical protein HFE75_16485 [Firmicutes bacterium]|nr:hypothetical protein [Bacillota bacterium]
MKLSKNKWNIMMTLLCVVTIFGMIGLERFRLFGMVLTPYRVIIPSMFVYCIWLDFKTKSVLLKPKGDRLIKVCTLFFIVWVIYGFAQLFLVDGISKTEGIKELFGLALGYAIILIVCTSLINGAQTKVIFNTIKVIYIGFLIFALIELIMRQHFYTSKLADEEIQAVFSSIDTSKNLATTIFYNVNDFATFLTIFMPIFLIYKSRKEMIFNMVVIGMVIAMLRILDAWITIFSAMVALLAYIVIAAIDKNDSKKNSKYIFGVVAISCYFYTYRIVKGIVRFFRRVLFSGFADDDKTANLKELLDAQLGGGGTSGRLRLHSYIDSFCDMIKETFGLGYGPSNYAAHLESGEELSLLADPHCLWSEILVQYGVVIFIVYLCLLFYVFLLLIHIYKKCKSGVLQTVILIDISYVFAVFAPSSFLTYGYSWLVIGLSIGSALKYREVLHAV